MERGAVFKSNPSQAVRLPKSVALPDEGKRVDVVAMGRIRILTLPVAVEQIAEESVECGLRVFEFLQCCIESLQSHLRRATLSGRRELRLQ